MGEDLKVFSFRLNKDELKQVDKICGAHKPRLSRSWVIRHLIREFLDKYTSKTKLTISMEGVQNGKRSSQGR